MVWRGRSGVGGTKFMITSVNGSVAFEFWRH